MVGEVERNRVLVHLDFLAKAVRQSRETAHVHPQFKDTEVESQILEADAEVIRGDSAMEVGPVETYRVNRVREVNVDTGHCILDVDGVGAGLPGKITDPALEIPNNVYTTALNTQEPCLIEAKAIRRAGQIRRLYVSNATF